MPAFDLPPFQRIANDLRAAINSGELPPGSRLPSEGDLAAQYGVNRLTARRALRLLAAEQLIVSRPRRGTFVNEDVRERWDMRTAIAPQTCVVTTMEATDTVAGRPLGELLDIGADELVVCRTATHWNRDVPTAVVADYVPQRLADGTPLMRKAPADAAALLAEAGHTPSGPGVDELHIRPPRDTEMARLDLSAAQSVLDVVRRRFYEPGVCLLVSHLVFRTGPGVAFTYAS